MKLKDWLFLRQVRRFLAVGGWSFGGLTPVARAAARRGCLAEVAAMRRRLERMLDDAIERVQFAQVVAQDVWAYQAPAWLAVAVSLVFGDTGVWYQGIRASMSALPWPLALLVAVVFAVGLAAGWHCLFAVLLWRPMEKTQLQESVRVRQVVRWHRSVFWSLFSIGFSALILLQTVRFVPASWVNVALVLQGSLLLFAVLNITLPAAAGTASSLATFLGARDRAVEKRREIEELLIRLGDVARDLEDEGTDRDPSPTTTVGRAVASMVAILFIAASAARANDCLAAVDATASVLAADRQRAVRFVVESLPELREHYGCSTLVVAQFTDDGPWTMPRTAFLIPEVPTWQDCATAEPEPVESASFLDEFDNVKEAKLSEFRAACASEQKGFRESHANQWARLEQGIADALTVRAPLTGGTTSIAGFLGGVLSGPRPYALVVIVSDGLDATLDRSDLTVPDSVPVVMILTRADPSYADDDAVLAHAATWRARGVAVVLTSDLFPLIWSALRQSGAADE